jgi:dUTPase
LQAWIVDTIALGTTVMITADFVCTLEEAVDGNMFPRQSLYTKDGVTKLGAQVHANHMHSMPQLDTHAPMPL